MPRRKPIQPPVTAMDCTRELCQILDHLYDSLDEAAGLDLALGLYIVVKNAVQRDHNETVADIRAGVDYGDDPLRCLEDELQQLATIEGVLSGIKSEPAREGR